jgi:peptidyl-prolyl cis-trans isomerase C
MTTLSSDAKRGAHVRFAAAASVLAIALFASLPLRAEDANPVLVKVNGAEIRQSDVALAEEELGPSLAQMDPAT